MNSKVTISLLACGLVALFVRGLFGQEAFTQIKYGTSIKRVAHLATLTIDLQDDSFVQIQGDVGMILAAGSNAPVWSGVMIDPPSGQENFFLRASMRWPEFTVNGQWLPISTTHSAFLTKGKHTIYWNVAVFGGLSNELQTDNGGGTFVIRSYSKSIADTQKATNFSSDTVSVEEYSQTDHQNLVLGDGPTPWALVPPKLDIARMIVKVDATLAVDCQFQLKGNYDQSFFNSEYRYAVFDHDGIEVDDALVFRLPQRTILLPKTARSVSDPTDATFDATKLTKGETYYLMVSVRNVSGLAEFTVPK